VAVVVWQLFGTFCFLSRHFSLTRVLYSLVVCQLLSGFPTFQFDLRIVAVVWQLLRYFCFLLVHFSLTPVLFSLVVCQLLSGCPTFQYDPVVVAAVVWQL
jgi:hypothetical protein